MAKYRKKPVVIEAFKWTGGPDQIEDPEWIVEALQKPPIQPGAARIMNAGTANVCMYIATLEGQMTANPGDYIIRGVNGELYPCKPDIFRKTYELVE